MKRVLVVAALTGALLGTIIPSAVACSCAPSTRKQRAEWADAVFTGRARSVTETTTQRVVRFRVRIVYKGRVDRRVEVTTALDGAACGCEFEDGARYTVFGERSGRDSYSTNICSGTRRGRIDPDGFGLPPGDRR